MVTTTLGITCLRAWQTLPRTRQEASQALRPDSLMDAVTLCRCGAEAATEKMKINGCACFDKTLYTDTEIWISCNFLYVTKCYYCFLFPNHLEVETSESWGQVTRRWWKHWKVWNPSAGQPGPNPAGSHPASAPPVNPACSPGLCATPLAAPQGNPASPPGSARSSCATTRVSRMPTLRSSPTPCSRYLLLLFQHGLWPNTEPGPFPQAFPVPLPHQVSDASHAGEN